MLNSPSIFSKNRCGAHKQRFACRIVLELPIEPGYRGSSVCATVTLEVCAHMASIDTGDQGRNLRW